MVDLATGKLDGQKAFMMGALNVEGNIMLVLRFFLDSSESKLTSLESNHSRLAMKLTQVLQSANPVKSKL